MKVTIATVAIVLFTGSTMSQQPYAGLQERTIKTNCVFASEAT
jgi:hypothetical protein